MFCAGSFKMQSHVTVSFFLPIFNALWRSESSKSAKIQPFHFVKGNSAFFFKDQRGLGFDHLGLHGLLGDDRHLSYPTQQTLLLRLPSSPIVL